MARQIVRAGTYDLSKIYDFGRDQRGVWEFSGAHRYIDFFRDEVHGSVRDQEVYRYARIAAHEPRQRRGKMVLYHHRRSMHPQMTAWG